MLSEILRPRSSFDRMVEADVRESIIAPVLKHLGYDDYDDSENKILRELPLRYSYSQLGLKDPKKDPALRGKPDYILEVGNQLRWVIEAKSGAIQIGEDDVHQARSYAMHPEVGAVLYEACAN